MDFDLQRDAQLSNIGFDEETGGDNTPRSKTSLRLRFEAESKVIQSRLGSLEDIRQNLGLSRRKLAELLFVDPSAITRWQKDPASTPPWVWRSLSWYLELEEKDPNWAQWREWFLKKGMREPQQQLQPTSFKNSPSEEEISFLRREIDDARRENLNLKEQMDAKETLGLTWKALLLMNSLAWLGYVALKAF